MTAADDSELETILENLLRDKEHAAVFQRILTEYPEELTLEVVSAALRRGLISAAEAIRVVRDGNFSFRKTVGELASLGRMRGWQARDLVLEALEGQPH